MTGVFSATYRARNRVFQFAAPGGNQVGYSLLLASIVADPD
jgi:hypothetical protein